MITRQVHLTILATACLIGAPLALEAKSGAVSNNAGSLEARVRSDIASVEGKAKSDRFAYYNVPAMSNIKRTMHTYPVDGLPGGTVRIIAAKGEFEPASIVLYPFADAGKVEVKVSDLVGRNGKVPAAAIDVKVVKVWYQTGTAWHSYFADTTGRELVPELLLNDENLIKVDQKTQDNHLRVDYPKPRGSEYIWISNPLRIDVPFNDQIEPVSDAATLQPFSLTKGEFKQLWVTLEAPKNAEGTYSGTIAITVDGRPQGAIPIEVLVLPFELPDPKTNYDLTREYYTCIYNSNSLEGHVKKNGGDLEKAKARLFNEYANMRKHNLLYPIIDAYDAGDDATLKAQLEIYKKAGLRTDAIFGAVPGIPSHDWMTSPEVKGIPLAKQSAPKDLYQRMDRSTEIVKGLVGHTNIYAFGWDEPAMHLLVAERLPWKYLQEKGVKIYTTGHDGHLSYGGYNEDFINYGGSYNKETSAKWHSIGVRITHYAAPHTGPENPDFVRRTHGMDTYLADCDGTNNYMLNGSPWNDFVGGEYNFRSFNWVYPAVDAPIDTIQWEGYREAIDDVKYATLLQQLARQVIATAKVDNVYQGRMALQWLVLLDPKTCDLNAARMEMISYILKLRALL